MNDGIAFLFLSVILLPLGGYALFKPDAVKREYADGPYFKTFGQKPLWVFRSIGVLTIAMSIFFAYIFWTRHGS